jgi:hypothetical protein
MFTVEVASFMPVSCMSYFSTLNIEAIYSSETFIDFQRTIRRYIQKDRTLQKDCHDLGA